MDYFGLLAFVTIQCSLKKSDPAMALQPEMSSGLYLNLPPESISGIGEGLPSSRFQHLSLSNLRRQRSLRVAVCSVLFRVS